MKPVVKVVAAAESDPRKKGSLVAKAYYRVSKNRKGKFGMANRLPA